MHLKLTTTLSLLGLVLAMSCAARPVLPRQEAEVAGVPIVGLPCEGCELVFDGMPSQIGTTAELVDAAVGAAAGGEALVLEAIVYGPEGRPAPGTIVYAYHTDQRGIYPGRSHAAPHGTIRGWARADVSGRVRFRTIRPASYPDTQVEQHIHLHVIEPGRCTYYIGDVYFTDDPLLSAAERSREERARGGSGVVQPVQEGGVWQAMRPIFLGRNVPGYESCS